MKHINVIVPLYNEDEVVKNITNKLEFNLNKITDDWKIILIDDGSENDCWNSILKFTKNNNKLSAIKLSKTLDNIAQLKSNWYYRLKFTIVIDGDMQDDPKYIQELYGNIIKGYDVVYCEGMKERYISKFFSKIFYIIYNFLSHNKLNQKIQFCIFNEKL